MRYRPEAECVVCGTAYLGWPKGPNKYCSRVCRGTATKGPGNPNWKGGKSVRHDGRTLKFVPSDYRGHRSNGPYVLEYRLVMEQHLGRFLRDDEVVHHINGDPNDNRIDNLEVLSRAEHAREHIEEMQPRMQEGRRRARAKRSEVA